MGWAAINVVLYLHLRQVLTLSSKANFVLLYDIIIGGLMVVVTVLVAISRLLIAAHFAHQVIVGGLAGVVVATLLNKRFRGASLLTLLNSKLIFLVSAGSFILAVIVYNALASLNMNPNQTIEKAHQYCQSKEWLHIDSTLFFSIIRVSGPLAGLGVLAFVLESFAQFKVKETILNPNEKCIFTDSISCLFICPIILHLESYKISKENVNLFYFIAFLKFMLLPLYVIVLKGIFEIVFESLRSSKCKIK